MFQTTLDFLDEKSVVWNGTPAFADAVARAKAGVDGIDQAADKQQSPTTGITQDKGALRDQLEAKLLEVADQLSAYAAKIGNHELAAQVEMTKSSIDKMDESALEQTAERVVGLANDNIGPLADYDIVQADVDLLDGLRLKFAGKKTAPRVATSDKKTQTLSLPQLIADVRSIFRNEIDKMATKKKASDPDFYNGYFAARVIVNRTATHKSAKSNGGPKPPAP